MPSLIKYAAEAPGAKDTSLPGVEIDKTAHFIGQAGEGAAIAYLDTADRT